MSKSQQEGETAVSNEQSDTVQIFINTNEYFEPRGKISFTRVVEISYPDVENFPNATYSVIYERGGTDKPQGTLTKEGSGVQVVKGIRFRVKRTGES